MNAKSIVPRQLSLLAFFVLFAPMTLRAAAGTEGASFLSIPTGGRPAALGGAYTPLASDAYAPVFNAGGLGFLNSSQFAAMHLSYLESIKYEFASLVHPFSPGHSAGLSVQYLRPGDTQATDINGNPTGDFSGSYGAYSLAYGQAIGDRVGLGVVGKLVNATIAGNSANAYAADVGGLFKVNSRVRLSAVVANMGNKLKFVDQGDSLPLSFRLGGAVAPIRQVTVAVQGTRTKEGGNGAEGGVEWSPIPLFALRAGYKTDTTKQLSSSAGLTAGVGINLAGQQFDYAWAPMEDLGNAQYFSMVLQWGPGRSETSNQLAKRNMREERSLHEDNPKEAYNDFVTQKQVFPQLEPVQPRLR